MTISKDNGTGINLGSDLNGGSTNQDQYTNQSKTLNLTGIVNKFGGRNRLAAADAEVVRVQDNFAAYFEKNQNDSILRNYKAITISPQQTGNFGALALTNLKMINNVPNIFVTTLIVEKSRPGQLEPSQQHIDGVAVQVFVAVADAFTESYLGHVTDEVKRQYGEPNAQIVECGYQVIYDLTPLDTEQFQPVIDEAINAIDHAMDTVDPNREIFTLGMIVNNPAIRVRSRVGLDQYKMEPNGLPIRSDIRSELIISQMSNNRAPISDNSEIRLCETSAYVDLIYTPPAQTYQFFGGMQQQPINQPYYVPRVVLTNFGVDLPHSSLEFMLLGVASMASLARQRSYGVVWRNQFGSSSNNLRNLGAVGLQVPLAADQQPAILDVSGDVRDLYSLMETVIAPSPVFTLEIEQGGAGNWATSIFARAAQGQQVAVDMLASSADKLTNGNFSKIYAQLTNGVAQPFITSTDDLSYVGYYNRDGEYRDIRELDLLAVLNTVGQKDPDIVQDYLTTLVGPENIHIRLARRSRILSRIAKDVNIKAYSRKYDFSGVFIEALTRAVAACGLVINNDNILNQQQNNVYNQTLQNWASSMVNPQSVNPLFTATQQASNFNFNVGNLFGSRIGGQF